MKLGRVKNRAIFKSVLILGLCVYTGWFLKSRLTPQIPAMGAMGSREVFVTGLKVDSSEFLGTNPYIGSVEAINAVDLRPQITGYLEQVLFQEGSFVKENDILFIIEQDRYLATVNLREAELKQAEAEFVRAEKDYQRQKSLAKQNFASQAKLDESYSTYLQAKAMVKQAKANLDLAKINLAYTEIKTPFNGFIGKALVTEGNFVNTQVLARIVQLSPIRVAFSMSDKEFIMLREKYKNTNDRNLYIKLRLPDGSFMEAPILRRFSESEINARTATVAVYAEINNEDQKIFPGNFVNVFISDKTDKKVIVIPQRALGQDDNGNFVFVINKDSIVEQRHIALGNAADGRQEVTKGLEEGEVIIVQGHQKVSIGQKVKVDMIQYSDFEVQPDFNSNGNGNGNSNGNNYAKETADIETKIISPEKEAAKTPTATKSK